MSEIIEDKDKTKEQLIDEVILLRRQIAELEAAEAQRKLADGEGAILSRDLITRLNELRCFYDVGVASEESSSLDEFLDKVIGMVPLALQYPELARAEITLRGNKYQGKDFTESQYRISSDIKVAGGIEGSLTVYYTDEIPFLKEEVDLIRGLAERIGDVVGRVEAEEALRESEELYRGVIESASDVIWTLSPEATITSLSPAFETIMGWSCGEWIGQSFVSILHPDDLPLAMEKLQRALSGERVSPFELRFLSKSGEYLLAEVTGVPLILGEKVIGISGIARDITERRKAEVALRESEEKFRTFMETASDLMHIDNKDGNFIYVNDSMARTLGYSKEEMIGMHITSISTEEDAKIFKAKSNKLIKQGMFSHETVWLTKEGEKVYGEEKVVAFYDSDGNFMGGRGVFRDVTERRKAVESLQESEEKCRTFMETASDLMHIADKDGNITYVNDSMARTLGYSKEELVGMHVTQVLSEESSAGFRQRIEKLVREGEFTYELVRLTKGGEEVYGETKVVAIYDTKGNYAGSRGIFRDVTERRRLEGEKKELERKAYLESRLATIGEMASGVAHEINNPLVGVIGFAEMLVERNDLPEDVIERLKIIHDGGQRVASIVDRLLSFARQSKAEKAYVDINQIIETTLKLRAYEMETAGIEVVSRLAPELPQTVADAGHLQEVFINLIMNAEKEMVLAHGNGKLLVRTEAIDKTIRISFKDDGPGIAKENIDRIFDPFFTTREVGQGTGLGLSICQGIIAEHGGQIYVKSKPGKGATLIVEVPVVSMAEQLELFKTDVDEPRKVAKARILVVDDEPTNLQYLSDVLAGEGHEVETVDIAADALKKIEEGGYDLVLLDIKMPGMSGIELYKRIQKVAPSLVDRVVFITGDVMGVDTTDFLFKTGASYITKPFKAGQLKGTINRVLLAG